MSAPAAKPVAMQPVRHRAVLTYEHNGKQAAIEGTVIDGATYGLNLSTEWGMIRVDLRRRVCETVRPYLPSIGLGRFVDLRVEAAA